MKKNTLQEEAIKKAERKIFEYEATVCACRTKSEDCGICDDAKKEIQVWNFILNTLQEQPIPLEICKCEMPAKEHKLNRCWRCKKPIIQEVNEQTDREYDKDFETFIKNRLAIRGFAEKNISNNRGLIGATIIEVLESPVLVEEIKRLKSVATLFREGLKKGLDVYNNDYIKDTWVSETIEVLNDNKI